MFKWSGPQEKLTEDVICALSAKFSMRLDLARKLIEFASPISEEVGEIFSTLLDSEVDGGVLPLDAGVSTQEEEGLIKKTKAD